MIGAQKGLYGYRERLVGLAFILFVISYIYTAGYKNVI